MFPDIFLSKQVVAILIASGVWLIGTYIAMRICYDDMKHFLKVGEQDEARTRAIWLLLTPLWPVGLAIAIPVGLCVLLVEKLIELYKVAKTVFTTALGGKP